MALTRPKYSQIYDSDYKNSCRVATTGDVTLTGGAPNSVDGITLVLYDRVLVRSQATSSQNGIYFVTTLGTGSNGTWTRSLDANDGTRLTSGTTVNIEEGLTLGGKMYRMTTPNPITIGSSAIAWTDVSGGGAAAGGLNGQVQFNSTNAFGGATYLTYITGTGQVIANAGIASSSTSTGTMVVTGGVGVSGSVNAGNFTTSNAQITGGSITGSTGSFTTLTATNFTSGNADITGTASQIGVTTAGAVDRIGSIYSTTENPTNFSTANALITGGSITGTNGGFTTLTATNFTSANAHITGSDTGIGISHDNTVSRIGSIYSTTENPTNFSTANALITGGSITGGTGAFTTLTSTNFSAANAVSITGASIGTAVVTNLSSGNARITGGSITGGTGAFTTLQATNLSSGNLQVSGSILPTANASYNIGSSTAWFNNIYGISSQAKYADLAEKYKSDAVYEPGTVVVFGGEKEITISTVDHDPTVAGVISTDPAYLMNADTDGLPVAFTGRVPCKVLGPVKKGQVLVTSHIMGVAQAINNSKYVPGCVIGKSLETIETTEVKTIEVVVGRF